MVDVVVRMTTKVGFLTDPHVVELSVWIAARWDFRPTGLVTELSNQKPESCTHPPVVHHAVLTERVQIHKKEPCRPVSSAGDARCGHRRDFLSVGAARPRYADGAASLWTPRRDADRTPVAGIRRDQMVRGDGAVIADGLEAGTAARFVR